MRLKKFILFLLATATSQIWASEKTCAGVQEAVAGNRQTCLVTGGQLICKGSNLNRQGEVPSGLVNPRGISLQAEGFTGCALTDQGAKCWGENDFGQTEIPAGWEFPEKIGVRATSSCALMNGKVKCWGYSADVPSDLEEADDLSVGQASACIITKNKALRCWHGIEGDYPTPNLQDVQKISVGTLEVCAIHGASDVTCWGFKQEVNDVPKSLVNPKEISVGDTFACAIDDHGVQCWGRGHRGQTEPPKDLKNPRQLSSGRLHSCVMTDDGPRCWGVNFANELDIPGCTEVTKNPLADIMTASCKGNVFGSAFYLTIDRRQALPDVKLEIPQDQRAPYYLADDRILEMGKIFGKEGPGYAFRAWLESSTDPRMGMYRELRFLEKTLNTNGMNDGFVDSLDDEDGILVSIPVTCSLSTSAN